MGKAFNMPSILFSVKFNIIHIVYNKLLMITIVDFHIILDVTSTLCFDTTIMFYLKFQISF